MTRDVARLSARTFDLLVIGGGICGLTIAADAAQRGLSVALVERDDFGSANSFNHLRTIHGGLRYLQRLDLARARESIRERRTLARIAPTFVRPMPFVLPLASRLVRGPMMMRVGLWLDAVVAADRNEDVPDSHRLPPGRVLGPSQARGQYPALRDVPMHGAAVWHDYVTVEADRLTLAWALAATNYGATLLNHVSAASLLKEGSRVEGATVTDAVTGRTLDVSARLVVNATGGDLEVLPGVSRVRGEMPLLRAMNLVTRLEAEGAAIGAASAAGRALFMVPWRQRAIFGTWESDAVCRPSDRSPTPRDVASFVRDVATAFPAYRLTSDDVTLVHRGLVPAVVTHGGRVALEGHQRILDHASGSPALHGLVSVAGTKYTTARAVAETVTNQVLAKLGREPVSCRTAETPLPYVSTNGSIEDAGIAPPHVSMPGEVRSHLSDVYGPAHVRILALAQTRSEFDTRVCAASPVLTAQIVWAVRHEMAVTLADAVIRRTPLGALGHPGAAVLTRTAGVMGAELGWSDERVQREIEEVDAFYRL